MYCRAASNNCCRLAAAFSAASLLLGLLAGCGGRQDPREMQVTGTGALRRLVNRVADGTETAERFENMFIEGSVPADRAKYAPPMMFRLEGEPDISGSTATFTVKVFRVDPETELEEPAGEKTWTAEKDADGTWKLKDVPLP